MSEIDVEPRGRGATGAVIIAVIFLAVLGTGVGIVLGSQAKNDKGDNVANNTTTSASPSPSVSDRETVDPNTSDPGNTGTRTRTPTGGTKSYRPTAKDDCPQQTDEAAGTSLTVKLYIRTNSAEVWICEGGGRTVYQGHLRGRPFPSATSDTSLYIGSVHYEAGVYAATNGNTTYFVSPERLRREENDVEKQNESVVETYSG
jgi:hypothetical protein